MTCPYCKTYFRAHDRKLTVDEVARYPGAAHPDRRALIGCLVVGGYGFGLRSRTYCNVRFEPGRIEIDCDRPQPAVVPYETVTALELGGQGRRTTGGGFIGGGFGAEGIAEGMAVAGVLNTLTTRTTTESLISLKMREWQLILFFDKATPAELRVELAPAFGRIEAAARALAPPPPPPPPPPSPPAPTHHDLAGQLGQLASLHRDGAINDDEFEAAKRRVIAGDSDPAPTPPPPQP